MVVWFEVTVTSVLLLKLPQTHSLDLLLGYPAALPPLLGCDHEPCHTFFVGLGPEHGVAKQEVDLPPLIPFALDLHGAERSGREDCRPVFGAGGVCRHREWS